MTITKYSNQSKLLSLTLLVTVFLLFTGCGGDDGPAERNPEITAINPTSGPPGTEVTISGSNFSPTTSENTVTFAGKNAAVTAASESELVAIVPDSAESGAVAVTVDGNTATGPGFTVEAEAPVINSIMPDSGAIGTEVTIHGLNFSPTVEENSVSFNGTVAQVSSATDTTLVTVVPEGATSGPVEVTVNGQTTNGVDFTVLTDAVAITSFAPDSGAVGAQVVIYGMNFSATTSENAITFNGTSATVVSASADSLVTEVPEGATSGPIEVTVGGETATSSADFTVTAPPPEISSVQPLSGSVGTEVTITGTNFSATPEENTVTFGGVEATIISASETQLVTEVPQGANSGPIEITVNGQTTTGPDFEVVINNVMQAIASDSELSTLADLLQDTDLQTTLEGAGSYTVIAPTNAAFNSYPPGFIDNLSQEQLVEILSYHIVGSGMTTAELDANGPAIETLQGDDIYYIGNGTFNNKFSIISENDAGQLEANIETPNGIIHKIDQPLLPDAYLDVFDITYKRPITNKFACHCISDRINLDEALHNESIQYTVFAPSTEAFANRAVPVDSLSDAELESLMNYHIVEGQALMSSELVDGQVLNTRNGEDITVSVAADGTISLNNGAATVIVRDLVGTNGVVYVIDNVLEIPSGGT